MDSIGAWMSSSEKTAAAVARATRRRTWPGCGRWCCLCSARMAARTVLPPSNCGRRWRTTTACISSISYAESLRKPWGVGGGGGTPRGGGGSTPRGDEAVRRVQLIDRMQHHVNESARIYDDALAQRDAAALGEFLYPSEVNLVLQGGSLAAARRGVFVEWRSRVMFALDPLIQPHVGGGGYLGLRYVVGRGFRRGFADFFGTTGGLLSGTAIDITTVRGRAAHLARGYLEKGLILTY